MANFSSHFFPVSVTLVNLFGDAAVKNVGTTAHTVAAGDDYRIIGGYNAYTIYTQNSATWTPTTKKFDFVESTPVSFTYSGIAISGTNDTSNTWTIKRIAYNTATYSVSNVRTAFNTSWHGRLTATYI